MTETLPDGVRLSDPNWYRAHYALAVQCLQIATVRKSNGSDPDEVGWPKGISADAREWRKPFGNETQQLLKNLYGDRASTIVHLDDAAAVAVKEAEDLIGSTVGVLDRAGWHWVGRRPPSYLLWLKRRRLGGLRERPPGSDAELARFLSWVVEPAAVTLLFSARAVIEPLCYQEIVPAMPQHASDRHQPLDRRRERSTAWLRDYLVGLVADGEVTPTVRARIAARLGRTRLRAPRRLSFRVRYNLACLFSRLAEAAHENSDESAQAEFTAIAVNQLELSLRGLPDENRAPLAEWAESDPGLQGLRAYKGGEFAAIVAKWHTRGRRRLENAISESDVVRRIAYDVGRSALEVEFPDGSRYEYLDVPRVDYEDFEAAPSAGTFFNSRIKAKYPTIRLQ